MCGCYHLTLRASQDAVIDVLGAVEIVLKQTDVCD
jgi:hypothetical protein